MIFAKNFKTLSNYFIFLLVLCIISCDNSNNQSITGIFGKWNLINVSCECAPVVFKKGEHIWVFNKTRNNVVVVNSKDEALQILETGTHKFELTNSTITIKSITYDYYYNEGKLYLANHPESDGSLIEFVR